MRSLQACCRPVAGLMLMVVAAGGCFRMDPRLRPDPGVLPLTPDDDAYGETLEIRYLGAGGYLLQRGDHAIATGPFYSSPHWLRVGFATIRPDTALIDSLHPRLPEGTLGAILIGHAHYDHLLDVPYIARKHHPRTVIYGSPSAQRLVLASEPSLEGRVVGLVDEVSRNGAPGQWIYTAGGRIRFMAIATVHNDHIPGLHLMQGKVRPGLKRVPRSAWRWKEGEILAYLIDFLGPDQKRIDFRIYYADVAPPGDTGLPPTLEEADQHRIDLALLALSLQWVSPGYPVVFLQAHQPRLVIGGHWESIFRNPARGPRRLRASDIETFAQVVTAHLPPDGKWSLANPGSIYRLAPEPQGEPPDDK